MSTDAALEAQMSRQRATNEVLKAWMASRPESEQHGLAVKARLRALAKRWVQACRKRPFATGGQATSSSMIATAQPVWSAGHERGFGENSQFSRTS